MTPTLIPTGRCDVRVLLSDMRCSCAVFMLLQDGTVQPPPVLEEGALLLQEKKRWWPFGGSEDGGGKFKRGG